MHWTVTEHNFGVSVNEVCSVSQSAPQRAKICFFFAFCSSHLGSYCLRPAPKTVLSPLCPFLTFLPSSLATDPPQILLFAFVILQSLSLFWIHLSTSLAFCPCLFLCFRLSFPLSSSSCLYRSPREPLLLTLCPASFSFIPSLPLPLPSFSLWHLTAPPYPALPLPCSPLFLSILPGHSYLFLLLTILPNSILVIV